MSAVLEMMEENRNDNQNRSCMNDSDLQAQELFNQIEIDEGNQKESYKKDDNEPENPFSEDNNEPKQTSTPKKLKKIKKLELNSDSDDNDQKQYIEQSEKKPKKLKKHKSEKKSKKQRKEQKRLTKKLKKQHKQKKQGKLKKLKKQGQNNQQQKQKSQQQWSGESSQSFDEDNDVSSDSLLERLNPSKKKIKTTSKQRSTEKKQGFSLKQLGNDAEVNYDKANDQNLSDGDESYGKKEKKNKKRVVEKKEISKNQQILKQLLQIGLCQQEQNEQAKGQGYDYDNGLQQVMNMKNTKKKGPKITNKLFVDMQINDQQENGGAPPQNIELEVKPRVSSGPSSITSSFLSKASKIKKARGMESEMHDEEYEKVLASKAKQSMSRLINQKQLEQADEVELNIKVPQVVKGREELNNSFFFKRVVSENLGKIDPNSASAKKKSQLEISGQSIKVSRMDLFKSISQQVKARKSRDVTHEIIKKSFKVTQLEEIQEMRKKNQQRRRKQALRGSDDEDQQEFEEENNLQQQKMVPEQQEIRPTNLGFMNFRIEVQNKEPPENIENLLNNIPSQPNPMETVIQDSLNQQSRKPKQIAIQLQNAVSEKQYLRLLQLQQGPQQQQEVNQQLRSLQDQQDQQDDEDDIIDEKDRDLNNMELQYAAEVEEDEEDRDVIIGQKVQLQVELQIQDPYAQLQSQQSEEEKVENQKEQPNNKQYQQYLNQLEEQGIKLKKNINVNMKDIENQKMVNDNEEKENYQQLENSQSNGNKNINGQLNKYSNSSYDQARKQFKKLRKIATILKTKKRAEIRTKKAAEFYEQEAEEGSDNEEHDDQVKQINDDDEAKQYDGLDLDADLQELIDNAVDINQADQQLAFKKYMEDVKIQDREELKRIMRGDFKRRDNNEGIMEEMEEDQKQRLKRMEEFDEYIKKKEQEDGKDLYLNEEELSKSNDDEQDEDDSEAAERKKKEKQKNITQEIQQQVQQLNEQNLKRYLDDCLQDSYRPTKIISKPIAQLPQSYQRSKKIQMRNTMKSIPSQESMKNIKLKKTSSHLNQMIMKNKEKIKPLAFTKNIPILNMNRR